MCERKDVLIIKMELVSEEEKVFRESCKRERAASEAALIEAEKQAGKPSQKNCLSSSNHRLDRPIRSLTSISVFN